MDVEKLVENLLVVGERIRDRLRVALIDGGSDSLRAVDAVEGGDAIFGLDRVSETELLASLTATFGDEPLAIVAEGLSECPLRLGHSGEESREVWWLLIDPIDGTRGLMYDKRSAWFLAGAARSACTQAPRLADITAAVQVEIPTSKQNLADQLDWADGRSVCVERTNLETMEKRAQSLRPSSATTLEQGFVTFSRFVPGRRDVIAAIEEEFLGMALGPRPEGQALCFEDQYISSGGQLYELASGRDRLVADIRPWVSEREKAMGRPGLLCSHPYDLAAYKIAQELGVVVEGLDGRPLDAPFDLQSDVAWVGWANTELARTHRSLFHRVLTSSN